MFNKQWNMNIEKRDNKFYVTVEGFIFNKHGDEDDYGFWMEINKFLKGGFVEYDFHTKEFEEADTIEKINELLDMIASQYDDEFAQYLQDYKDKVCQNEYECDYMYRGYF